MFLICLLLSSVFSQVPDSLAKWEAGLGYFYGDLADYPGSNESTVRSFPIPYFVYRGDIVRADRDGGIRTRFLKGIYYELDFSFSAAFPADSKNNLARLGMPDLNWMFEIGPRLKLHLFRNKYFYAGFNLPIRAVFDLDLPDIRGQGYNLSPSMNFTFPYFIFNRSSLHLSYTYSVASTKTHRYFYDVGTEYITPDRVQYSSENGEMGRRYGASITTRWDRLTLFLGFSLNDYKRAKNKESPLHTADYTRSYFIGFVYSMFQSSKQSAR